MITQPISNAHPQAEQISYSVVLNSSTFAMGHSQLIKLTQYPLTKISIKFFQER